MIDQLKKIMETDKDYSTVLKFIYENPYCEVKELIESTSLTDSSKVQGILKDLTEKFIVIELSSQASSNIESRVPKKVYLINPNLDNTIEEFV